MKTQSKYCKWALSPCESVKLFLLVVCMIKDIHGQSKYFEDTNNIWPNEIQESPPQSPINTVISAKLTSLDVICGKEFMTVRAEFNAPFNGIVFSKGTYGQNKCVYVKPRSGLTHATFNVRYDECGTKPDLQGKYFENTIVIQYGTDIIEALDEAKRLRCEWFEAYEKPATFRPAIPVADLDIIEMNFQGDEIDCWMSIQEGKGPWSSEISRIVTVGQPLSIVVAINDNKNQFDMKVKSCFAHDGIKPPIYLIDDEGCVLRPKMISPFKKLKNLNGKASLISYAQFLAFKFPDSVDVQIQCTVEVCRHGCIDTCPTTDKPLVNDQSNRPLEESIRKHVDHQSNSNSNLNRILLPNPDLLESASNFEKIVVEKSGDNHNVNVQDTMNTHKHNAQESSIDNNYNYLNDIASFLNNVKEVNNEYNSTDQTQPTVLKHETKVSDNNHKFFNNKDRLAEQSKQYSQNHHDINMQYSNRNNIHVPIRAPVYPIAQVTNIPLNPMYAPKRPVPMIPGLPNMLNPFGSMKLFNKRPQALPQLFTSYFNKNRRSQYVPNDNFEFINLNRPHQKSVFRVKRYIDDKQGEIGLKKGFQVVTSLDLSFSPNVSADQMQVFEGKPASVVYGICFSSDHFFYFICTVLVFMLAAISTCVYIIFKMENLKRKDFPK